MVVNFSTFVFLVPRFRCHRRPRLHCTLFSFYLLFARFFVFVCVSNIFKQFFARLLPHTLRQVCILLCVFLQTKKHMYVFCLQNLHNY